MIMLAIMQVQIWQGDVEEYTEDSEVFLVAVQNEVVGPRSGRRGVRRRDLFALGFELTGKEVAMRFILNFVNLLLLEAYCAAILSLKIDPFMPGPLGAFHGNLCYINSLCFINVFHATLVSV